MSQLWNMLYTNGSIKFLICSSGKNNAENPYKPNDNPDAPTAVKTKSFRLEKTCIILGKTISKIQRTGVNIYARAIPHSCSIFPNIS